MTKTMGSQQGNASEVDGIDISKMPVTRARKGGQAGRVEVVRYKSVREKRRSKSACKQKKTCRFCVKSGHRFDGNCKD